jgi:hypothetical protein
MQNHRKVTMKSRQSHPPLYPPMVLNLIGPLEILGFVTGHWKKIGADPPPHE